MSGTGTISGQSGRAALCLASGNVVKGKVEAITPRKERAMSKIASRRSFCSRLGELAASCSKESARFLSLAMNKERVRPCGRLSVDGWIRPPLQAGGRIPSTRALCGPTLLSPSRAIPIPSPMKRLDSNASTLLLFCRGSHSDAPSALLFRPFSLSVHPPVDDLAAAAFAKGIRGDCSVFRLPGEGAV
jgi:hypothetical protein